MTITPTIADHLHVRNILLQMLPTRQRRGEQAARTLNDILRTASNLVKADGDGAFHGNQGQAEGEVLENILNALANLALGHALLPRLKRSPQGDSWHRTEDKDGYTGRATFYRVLQQIRQSDLYEKANTGEISLTLAASGSDLAATAHTDFGAFAALYDLSPFVLSCSTPGALESIVGESWGSLYDEWQSDKEALDAGAATSELRISDQWLSDRAGLLERRSIHFDGEGAIWDDILAIDPRNAGSRLDNAVFADARSLGQRGGAADDDIVRYIDASIPAMVTIPCGATSSAPPSAISPQATGRHSARLFVDEVLKPTRGASHGE